MIVITFNMLGNISITKSYFQRKSEQATNEMVPQSTVAGPAATDVGEVGKWIAVCGNIRRTFMAS